MAISMKYLLPVFLAFLFLAPVADAATIGRPMNTLGIVGYWTFDGADTPWTSVSAGTAIDRSGFGYTGTLSGVNRNTSPATGRIGQGLNFNGSATQILTTTSPTNDGILTTTVTVSAWIKPDTLTGEHTVFAPASDFLWYVEQSNNTLSWRNGSSGGLSAGANFSSGSVLQQNVWQHVVFVGTPDTLHIYLNGTLVANTSTNGVSNSGTLGNRIGGTNSRFFSGTMDDVRVYNRALSANEVGALYNTGTAAAGRSNKGTNSSFTRGLTSYWTLDGSTINWNTKVAFDSSGNNLSGSMSNFITSTSTAPFLGKVGQALNFNGTNQTIFTTSLGTPRTVTAWINIRNTGATEQTITYFTSPNRLYFLTVFGLLRIADGGSGSSCVRNGSDAPVGNLQSSTLAIATNKWQFVAYTSDPDTKKTTFYLNNKANTASGYINFAGCATTTAMYLGSTNSRFLDGAMDDVRSFDRVLTSDEVMQIYNAGNNTVGHSNSGTSVTTGGGLVGYWTFDGSATNWATGKTNDLSGSGNTGSLISMSTSTSPAIGKVGQAFNFDGSTQYVSIADHASVRPTSITVSAWFKQRSQKTVGNATVIVGKWFATGVWGYSLETYDANAGTCAGPHTAILFHFRNTAMVGGAEDACLSSGVAAQNNTWYHAVATYDETTGMGRIYVNGVLKNQATYTVAPLMQPTSPLGIGAYNDNGTWTGFLDGSIDDIRIYNRVLSANEIKALYNAGR